MSNPRDDERRKFEARFGPKPSPHAYCWEFGFQCWMARAEQAETPRAADRDELAKWFFDSEAEVAEQENIARGQVARNYARWPEDAAIQPYCRWAYRRADAFLAKFAEAAAPVEDRPAPTPETFRNSCNRHSDCAAATERFKAANGGRSPGVNFHCHDEECEDCFGC